MAEEELAAEADAKKTEEAATRARAISSVQYPERFDLALLYGEGPLASDPGLTTSDRLLLDALSKQATSGPCNEPKPPTRDVSYTAHPGPAHELFCP